MGTSSSHGGPRGSFPLLPPWAQGTGDNGPNPDPNGDGPSPDPDADGTADQGADAGAAAGGDVGSVGPVPTMGNLRSAKIAMSRLAAGRGGGGGGGGVQQAANRYVSGRGGARGAARSALSGRRMTQNLAGFLGTLATGGIRAAKEAFSLEVVVGQPIEAALAVIVNAIAPAGATLEDAAARRAADDALCVLYERLSLEDGDFNTLESIDADTAREVLQASVVGYIYNRWLQDVGDRIEEHSVSADAAVNLERQVRQFVTETVRVDFSDIDVLRFDWLGPQGRELVERIYRDAYSLLEE